MELTLSKAEEKSLNQFFHALLWGSEVGYVLYGDKPICFEGGSQSISSNVFKVGYHLNTSINEGIRIWEKLNLSCDATKFLFIHRKVKDESSPILFINKQAFKQVFDKNAALFRYVLGSELTSEKLLAEFKNKDFFAALKNDNVLIGLLLGFGFENSLCVGRCEQISEEIYPHKETSQTPDQLFFLKCKKINPPLRCFSLQPSIGYSSLQQEWNSLLSKIEFASEPLERYSPKLVFGKMASHSSNDALIKNYEETQLKIIEVLDQSNWLELVLSQFYSEPVKVKITENQLNEVKESENIGWPRIIAKLFSYSFKKEFHDKNNNDWQEYIKGMEEAERRVDALYLAPFPTNLESQYSSKNRSFLMGFKIWSFYKFHSGLSLKAVIQELDDQKHEIDLSKFLEVISSNQAQIFSDIENHETSLARSHFNSIAKEKNAKKKCLFTDRLYYQQINSGNGSVIQKNQMIIVSYVLKTSYGNIIEHQENCTLDLSRAIKGFRQGFPGMKVGEQGILFIHPEWGIKDYLSPPYYSPYLITEFEIIENK